MNRIRLASLVAAVIITATAWMPFYSCLLHAPPLRADAAPAVDDVGDAALPVIVVTAARES